MKIKRGSFIIFGIVLLSLFSCMNFVSAVTHTLEIIADQTAPASESPSGSSGNPGTSYWTKTIDATKNEDADLINGYSENIGMKERVKIEVNNEVHYVGVVSIANNSDSAVIHIMSTPKNVTFYIGDEKKFELNADGYYDLYVKLNSIVNKKANVTIKKINEKITGEVIADNGQKIISDNNIPSNDKKIFGITLIMFYILIVIVIIVMIITVIIFIQARKNTIRFKKIVYRGK